MHGRIKNREQLKSQGPVHLHRGDKGLRFYESPPRATIPAGRAKTGCALRRKGPGGAVAISRRTPHKLGPVDVKLFICPCCLKDFTLEKYDDKTVLRCL
jgi:hypothetical protein